MQNNTVAANAQVSLVKRTPINTRKAHVHTCTRMVTAGVAAPINYIKARVAAAA